MQIRQDLDARSRKVGPAQMRATIGREVAQGVGHYDPGLTNETPGISEKPGNDHRHLVGDFVRVWPQDRITKIALGDRCLLGNRGGDMTTVDQLHATEAAYRDSSCISSNGNDLTVLGGWAPGALSLETKLPRITSGNPERILPRPGCERPLAQTPISCRRVPRGNSSDEGLTQTDYYPLRRSSVTLRRRKPS